MSLHLRMLVTFVRSSFRGACRVDAPSAMDFVVWPWEAEWKVISHVSLLSILDVARQDYMQRAGFVRLLLKNRWFVPIASVHVTFKRPILRSQRITVFTRAPYWNEKDILIEQEVHREGRLMATSVVRGMIKSGRETVDPRTVVAQLGGATVDEAAAARLEALIAFEQATAQDHSSRLT